MLRGFPEHVLRRVDDLAGIWDFAFLGDVDPDAVDLPRIVFDDRMAVPGSFDAMPCYAGRRGLVAYHRKIMLHPAVRHRIVFGAVHHWCRVFLDGKPIGEHANGFTRFALDIRGHAPGEAELVVLVDNRFDYQRAPLHLDYADWYHYGGITRGVELHHLGLISIDAVEVATLDLAARRVGVTVRYTAEAALSVALAVVVDGKAVQDELLQLQAPGGEIRREFALPEAALWTAETPALHTLEVRLGQDDVRERFGLRQVRTQGTDLVLNGEPLRLLGVNRHEAHPELGCALPPALLAYDLQILRDMGCNFVRGSHYPQDPVFLDLCDELGMLVWCETIGWQYREEHLSDARFVGHLLAHTDEMVAQSRNHPCIILWGLINEADSDKESCRLGYESVIRRLRQLDPTRPITYASHKWRADLFFGLCDVVSVNLYPGWYWDEIGDIERDLAAHLATAESCPGAAGKPMIVSEIGADAVPGYRDWNEDRWSETYQVQLLETVIETLFRRGDRVCGLGIWQFCDCRTSRGLPRILGKPCGFNMKGVVDAHRRPKEAYGVVKRLFGALARP